MDVFATLEKKVERLMKAYLQLQSRVSELEAENGTLRSAAEKGGGNAAQRISELESERTELRDRLAGLLGKLDTIDL